MFKIKKLNSISPVADEAFSEKYEFSEEVENPQAIMVRSFKMHDYPLNDELLAIARAGAGTNNIPIDKCTEKGIVVFNTPGANANAVKELVLCELFLGGRNIVEAINWIASLKGTADISQKVEKGKSNFVGKEILGKTIGIIGLGAIGRMVAESANALGMRVVGYDPYVKESPKDVQLISELDQLIVTSDFISVHIPLNDNTRGMFNKEAFSKMKDGSVLINNSRGELVNTADVLEAVNSGKLSRYITDFPTDELIGVHNIVCVPHLGASTPEAEDNCAYMAAKQLEDYLLNGNITNSVNFPSTSADRKAAHRVAVTYKNTVGYTASVASVYSSAGIDISYMYSTTRGEIGYKLIDTIDEPTDEVISKLRALPNTIRIRVL